MTRGKILIAEDDITQQIIMKHQFEEVGYEVIGFSDGAEIVDKVIKYMPDLVILDICLPHVDGWEITRQIKTKPETRHIPIVMVSSNSKEDEKENLLLYGCMDYFEKPVDTSTILDKLDICIKLGSIKKKAADMIDKTY